jgi:thiol-disulfide isomerase/thioredoxin
MNRFLFRFSAIFPALRKAMACLMFICLIITGSHQLSSPALAEEIQLAYNSPNIRPVTADQLMRTLEYSRAKATVLFFYTSWCPYCHRQFPIMDEIAGKYNNRDLNIVAVSLDKDPKALANYLRNLGHTPNFPTLLLNRNGGDIKAELSKLGVNFPGSIPFSAVFARNTKLVAQFDGFVDNEGLAIAVDSAIDESGQR